jgi:hypothetical protein
MNPNSSPKLVLASCLVTEVKGPGKCKREKCYD